MNKYKELVERNERALNLIEGLVNDCVNVIEQGANVKEGIALLHLMQEFIQLIKLQNKERHYMELISDEELESVLGSKEIQKILNEHMKYVEELKEQVDALYTKLLALRGAL